MPILLGLGVLVGVLVFVVNARPARFRITRARTIAASPATVHALIDSFRAWSAWSPWEKLDPAMQRTYSGPEAGVGAHYAWEGKKSGAGNMTITESLPGERVVLDLHFLKPIPAQNKTTFTLEAEGASTRVTWTMEGTNTFMGKLFDLVANMDKLVGKDFEAGLAAMETAATKAA